MDENNELQEVAGEVIEAEKEEKKDPYCRKWLFTCNNPQDHEWSIEKIIEILENWKAVEYWCIGEEVGVENQIPHIHFFIKGKGQIYASTIEKKFHGINRKMVNGTILDNRTYCFKDGKYIGTEKGKLHNYESNRESGPPPEEKGRGFRTDIADMYSMIKEGLSTYDIIEANPTNITRLKVIEETKELLRQKEFRNKRRLDLKVEYWQGDSRVGKTSAILDMYGDDKVYIIEDGIYPWDGYQGEDIVLFDDFRCDKYHIDVLLRWFDVYPLRLPNRFQNKTACYTKVYLTSNVPFEKNYWHVQKDDPKTWEAFCNRFTGGIKVVKKDTKGEKVITEYKTVNEYMKRNEDINGFMKVTKEQQMEIDELFGGYKA